jgi:hypothetical protein
VKGGALEVGVGAKLGASGAALELGGGSMTEDLENAWPMASASSATATEARSNRSEGRSAVALRNHASNP